MFIIANIMSLDIPLASSIGEIEILEKYPYLPGLYLFFLPMSFSKSNFIKMSVCYPWKILYISSVCESIQFVSFCEFRIFA